MSSFTQPHTRNRTQSPHSCVHIDYATTHTQNKYCKTTHSYATTHTQMQQNRTLLCVHGIPLNTSNTAQQHTHVHPQYSPQHMQHTNLPSVLSPYSHPTLTLLSTYSHPTLNLPWTLLCRMPAYDYSRWYVLLCLLALIAPWSALLVPFGLGTSLLFV